MYNIFLFGMARKKAVSKSRSKRSSSKSSSSSSSSSSLVGSVQIDLAVLRRLSKIKQPLAIKPFPSSCLCSSMIALFGRLNPENSQHQATNPSRSVAAAVPATNQNESTTTTSEVSQTSQQQQQQAKDLERSVQPTTDSHSKTTSKHSNNTTKKPTLAAAAAPAPATPFKRNPKLVTLRIDVPAPVTSFPSRR